jgi:hypothetical protein
MKLPAVGCDELFAYSVSTSNLSEPMAAESMQPSADAALRRPAAHYRYMAQAAIYEMLHFGGRAGCNTRTSSTCPHAHRLAHPAAPAAAPACGRRCAAISAQYTAVDTATPTNQAPS